MSNSYSLSRIHIFFIFPQETQALEALPPRLVWVVPALPVRTVDVGAEEEVHTEETVDTAVAAQTEEEVHTREPFSDPREMSPQLPLATDTANANGNAPTPTPAPGWDNYEVHIFGT